MSDKQGSGGCLMLVNQARPMPRPPQASRPAAPVVGPQAKAAPPTNQGRDALTLTPRTDAAQAGPPGAKEEAEPAQGSAKWWDRMVAKLIRESVISDGMRRFQMMEERMRERALGQN